MFVIEMRKTEGNTFGSWFPIWHSADGADTAAYLKQLVEHEQSYQRMRCEYRMMYVVK